MHLSKQGTPLIKSRLAYLKSARDGKPDVALVTDGPRWGGQPWIKLNLQTLDYVNQNGTKVRNGEDWGRRGCGFWIAAGPREGD